MVWDCSDNQALLFLTTSYHLQPTEVHVPYLATFTLANMEVGTLKAMQVVTVKIPIRPTPFLHLVHC